MVGVNVQKILLRIQNLQNTGNVTNTTTKTISKHTLRKW